MEFNSAFKGLKLF